MKEDFKIANHLLASKRKRFLNFIIDSLIMIVIVRLTVAFINISEVSDWLNSFDLNGRYLFWSFISFVYYSITEVVLSRSPAKYFTKTIVVMEDGSKPSITAILARNALRIFPFEPFSFLRGRALGFHDENSKTFVVLKAKLENQKKEYFELLSLEKS